MPSKQKMHYFTPELYQRFNSPDDTIALAADAEWEAAIARYDEHLASLREKMPAQVVELSQLCLHDGEILQRQEQQQPPDVACFGLATLAVRLDDTLVTLLYFLRDHISEQPSPEDWPFSRDREHWLYDEIHWKKGSRGGFEHMILMSSGVVLAIPFSAVLITRLDLSRVDTESNRQSA